MKIYGERSRQNAIAKHLFENQTYYIDFEQSDEDTIACEINRSKLSNFVEWHKGNRYATLTIINFIGNIYFFGDTYDVKSKKFLPDLTGSEQFQTIINDIQELSKNIIFTYSSPSFVLRQIDYKDANPTLLIMFNYFKRIILDWNNTINLQSNIHKVIGNPNFKYSLEYKVDSIQKMKKIDGKILRSLASDHKYYVKINPAHTHLADLPITQFISQKSPNKYFPTKALMKKKYLSYDTPENRFVKFFFEYIENLAYRLNAVSGLPASVIKEKENLLSFCRTILNQPFFNDVGEMVMIPSNSTVLLSRAGYKEIFLHFSRSRFGIKHIFEEFEQESMSIDLKRISDLYEYWVFYKIAVSILGREIIFEQQDVVFKNGDVAYGICFRNEHISVYYNWTESRARKSAYSVSLRPDTTVVIQHGNRKIKLVFDAKYKVRHKDTEDGIEQHIKPEDIYKMHTYLDAIDNCLFAIAIYPGSEFYFYERDLNYSIRRDVSSIETFEGVGAIPLVPNNKELDDQFNKFIHTVLEKLI